MSDPFLAELRDEVAAAARRVDADAEHHDPAQHGHGTRWPLAGAAALLVVAALGATFVLRPTPASANLQVIRQGDELVIRLIDVATRPQEIEMAATEAGLDVQVVEVPVGPSNVGRFVGDQGTGPFGQDVFRPEGLDGQPSFDGFRIPVDYDGQLMLRLGRPARAGETWAVGSIATSAQEPLACAPLLGAPLSDTLRALTGTDLRIVSIVDTSTAQSLSDPSDDDLRSLQDQIVTQLTRASEDELFITVLDDPDSAPPIVGPEGC